MEIAAIDADAWRLCDKRERPSDAAHVIAYIERVGSAFDAVWMTGPRRRSTHASLAECVAAAEGLLESADATPGAGRPIEIAHLPPR
ncbi:MAG: hypothetical protein DI566_12875 [Microbacterium sp.]|nr:MAG: hypothetical protein DI566_12875 [Microbacterium sp.]